MPPSFRFTASYAQSTPPRIDDAQFLILYEVLILNFVLTLVAVAVLSMFILGRLTIVAALCVGLVSTPSARCGSQVTQSASLASLERNPEGLSGY